MWEISVETLNLIYVFQGQRQVPGKWIFRSHKSKQLLTAFLERMRTVSLVFCPLISNVEWFLWLQPFSPPFYCAVANACCPLPHSHNVASGESHISPSEPTYCSTTWLQAHGNFLTACPPRSFPQEWPNMQKASLVPNGWSVFDSREE